MVISSVNEVMVFTIDVVILLRPSNVIFIVQRKKYRFYGIIPNKGFRAYNSKNCDKLSRKILVMMTTIEPPP